MMVLEPLLWVVRNAPRGWSWPRLVAVCSTLLLVPLAPPAARALEPESPPSASPDSGVASTARPATSPAGLERVRLAAAIERLRARAGHHAIRVWTGGKRVVVQHPVFDSLGVRPGATRRTAETGAPAMIAWRDVRRIDVRGSNFVRGAILGGLPWSVLWYSADYHSSDSAPGMIIIPSIVVGGTIGAFSGHWSRFHGWPPPDR